MAFCRLSALIDLLRSYDICRTDDLRYDAANLMLSSFPQAPPAMINVAALALSMERLVVHEVSGGVVKLVHAADLRSIPDEPPKLMQHSWLIESADLDAPLWGNTVCFGGYRIDDAYFLVGFLNPDGAVVAKWVPEWGSGDQDIEMPVDSSPLIDNIEGHREWAYNAARFVLILGLLLEAYATPVEVKESQPGRHKRSKQAKRARSWSVQRIVLNKLPTCFSHSEAENRARSHSVADRQPQRTIVRGHLRRVRYGPHLSQARWQWIEGYEARRWVAPKIRYKISE